MGGDLGEIQVDAGAVGAEPVHAILNEHWIALLLRHAEASPATLWSVWDLRQILAHVAEELVDKGSIVLASQEGAYSGQGEGIAIDCVTFVEIQLVLSARAGIDVEISLNAVHQSFAHGRHVGADVDRVV